MSTRNKTTEVHKRQATLARLMFWSALFVKPELIAGGLPSEPYPSYGESVVDWCLERLQEQNNREDCSELLQLDVLRFHLHFAEAQYHPWGIATNHLIASEWETARGITTPFRLPNFLLPTGCLYCGESLGFESYSNSSIKKTKHENCANSWNKGIRKKVAQVNSALARPAKGGTFPDLLDMVWSAYIEMASLYDIPYFPRFTLIERYQNIPQEAWVYPLTGEVQCNELLKLPFLDMYSDFQLSLTEDSEELEVSRDPQDSRPIVTLSSLDSYFKPGN